MNQGNVKGSLIERSRDSISLCRSKCTGQAFNGSHPEAQGSLCVAPGFDSMDTSVGNQCQMVVVDALSNKYDAAKPSTIMASISIIFCILVIYTLIAFYVGYRCGFRLVRYKSLKGKMTMTRVTYTSVRKVERPRFEYSTLIDGCWDLAE